MAKLYVVTDRGVYRLPLDIGKLRNRDKIPPKPDEPPHVKFEKLEVDGNKIPCFLHPIVVDGHLLLAGGWGHQHHSVNVVPNIDVAYVIDDDRLQPIPSPLCCLSMELCHWLANLGRTTPGVCLYQFGSSFYVLDARDPKMPSFRMFELSSRGCTQKVLPSAPDDIRVLNQTGWGHKFHIITSSNPRTRLPSLRSALFSGATLPVAYTFNLLEERWDRCRHQFRAAVKYEGFLIGLVPSGKLVCCRTDSHGNPDELTPSRVLHDMFDICMLRHICLFNAGRVFMGLHKDGDDDYIWLVYTLQGDLDVSVSFLLFRVFIQDGVICTIVEASYQYYFPGNCFLCTAFLCAE